VDAAAKGPRVKPPKSGENALAWAMYADNPACLKGAISSLTDVAAAAEAEVKASSADRSALCPPSDEGDSSCVPWTSDDDVAAATALIAARWQREEEGYRVRVSHG
jgi:hypothetical protein